MVKLKLKRGRNNERAHNYKYEHTFLLTVVPEEKAKITKMKKKQELILHNSSVRSVGISGKRMTDFTNKLHFCRCVKLENNWNL